jgi:hypothetical protein
MPDLRGKRSPFDTPWALWSLLGGLLAARLVYLFAFCPYDLIEDEAHYWEWSRRLDWSFYSKGPGIAVAIRAATGLFGTSEASIRTVAALASFWAALGVALLGGLAAARPSRGERFHWRVAFFSAAAFQLAPMFSFTAIFATIDGPFTACWSLACVCAFLALQRRSAWAWPGLGLALGVGFLFKYTILLLIPGVLLYALLGRRRLNVSRAWPALLTLAAAIFLACTVPVLVWNERQGWPTVHHLLGHLGMAAGDMPVDPNRPRGYDPKWTLDFLGTQLGAIGPGLILAIYAAAVALGSGRAREGALPGWSAESADGDEHRAARLFLVCCAAPILLFYLVISFMTEPEGNWAMGGYVTLLVLAGWAAADGLEAYRARVAAWRAAPLAPGQKPAREGLFRRKPETVPQVLWHAAVAYGVVASIGMLRIDLIARMSNPDNPGRAGSLTHAGTLSQHAAALAHQLETETGRQPFYIAQHYGRASILAFYVPGRPVDIRCSSSRMVGRKTQYDFWPGSSLDDPALLGRPAVLSGATFEQWRPLFERVVPVESAAHDGRLNGEHKKDRLAFLGYGYKGWPK